MNKRNQDPSGPGPDTPQTGDGPSLSSLKSRLNRARGRQREREGTLENGARPGGAGVVLRTGVELAGTLVVGVGIGWLLDRWLGTTPWFLVVFFFLGGAAGVLNVYRAVKHIGLAVGYDGGEGKTKKDDH